ncbi:hypothetical protein [Pseudaminobacter sp. NGMCC 1.201702]|uniref:hypothetical protein n=1 Tax=Pseudaminobacter sp. NGMCC 1.201702 TaxID=3391825 RepID=UPI0039F050A7
MMPEHSITAPKINLDDAQSTASALREISRRRFLLNTAMAGAAVAVAAPAVAAEPEMTPREKVIWHVQELVRLARAGGAGSVTILVCGHGYGGGEGIENCKSVYFDATREQLKIDNGMFAAEGGDA